MSYSFEGRVRYSEIGENGCLNLGSILNYFQDCCLFQTQSFSQGLDAVSSRNRLWVMSAWQVVISRSPALGEEIVVSTWPYAFKGFMGLRNFTMKTREGENLIWANSYWSYLNRETGLPARFTPEDLRGYELEEKLEMDYAPRKIPIPEDLVEMEPFPVRRHHLDTNLHVNNSQYVRMAEDYLPEEITVHSLRAEYKGQTRLGDVICPKVSRQEDKVIVVLAKQQGDICCVVEFG